MAVHFFKKIKQRKRGIPHDKLRPVAKGERMGELLIRTFSPHFLNMCTVLLRCQIKRQNKTDPEELYKKLIYIIVGLTLYLENPKRILQYINN